MLVLLPDGVYLRDFAAMLRKDDRCYTFTIENTTMLCKGNILQSDYSYNNYLGHPAWDPKNPGKNVQAMEKWDDYHEQKRIEKLHRDVDMWEETIGQGNLA